MRAMPEVGHAAGQPDPVHASATAQHAPDSVDDRVARSANADTTNSRKWRRTWPETSRSQRNGADPGHPCPDDDAHTVPRHIAASRVPETAISQGTESTNTPDTAISR
jgi:hypothetical protein